jgi:hypothetical protein
MAHLIIYDPEANIAALVDPEAPAALGPIAVGEEGDDPRHPLQEFVAGLESPPETMATWPLFNEWSAYVRAIVDLVEAEVEAAQEEEGADSPAPAAPVPPGESPDPPSPAEAPEEGPGGDSPPDPPEEATGASEAELSERIAAAPHTPAKDGREECWMCHGDLQIDGPNGRVECPVCHGAGTVDVPPGE